MPPTRICGALLTGCAAAAQALTFPDSASLARDYDLKAKEPGISQLWKSSKAKSDESLLLEWREGEPVSATLSRTVSFENEDITRLSRVYGAGTEWHPLPDPLPGSAESKALPGLMQQWASSGGGDWLGAGLSGDRFFLVFRSAPFVEAERLPPESLAMAADWRTVLDTLPGYVLRDCVKTEWPKADRCYEGVEPALPAFAVWKDSLAARSVPGKPFDDLYQAAEATPDGERDAWIRDFRDWRWSEGRAALLALLADHPWILNASSASLPNRMGDGAVSEKLRLEFRGSGRLPDPLPLLAWTNGVLRLSVSARRDGRLYVRVSESPNP